MNAGSPPDAAERQRTAMICLVLAVATALVYWPIHAFDFINLDDPFIIFRNPFVTGGLTWRGIAWGLGTSYFEYWHPLTWWSHMLDCELFGLHAGWHHVTSLVLHIANTLVLFLALRQMTGRLERSAVVAGLFALHPMHVESVVWLAERKDVLSTLFWLLSIWAYAGYVRALPIRTPKVELFYRLSLLMFLLGIMSKPMVITLPFVLLLLDYWPLNRYQIGASGPDLSQGETKDYIGRFLKLLREKTAYFILAGISCFITFSNVKSAHNLISANKLSWGTRLANIPVSYARYLGKLVWPENMSAFYPMPAHWPTGQVIGSALILLLISWVAAARLRTAPYLAVGWCIFLGTLVPTISLVPVGWQSIADRYTYMSYVGLFMAMVWGAAEVLDRLKAGAVAPAGLAFLALLGCACVTRVQAGYWRDSFTLWPHCLAVTENNFIAHYNLGYGQQNAGQLSNAIENYEAALKIRPDDWQANLNMGRALAATGRMGDSTNFFVRAMQSQPDSPLPHRNLGLVLMVLGDLSGAVPELTEAVRLDPHDPKSQIALGEAFAKAGKSDDAIRCFQEALRLTPGNADANYQLGVEELKQGRVDDAVASLTKATMLDPSSARARSQLDAALKKQAEIQSQKPAASP